MRGPMNARDDDAMEWSPKNDDESDGDQESNRESCGCENENGAA